MTGVIYARYSSDNQREESIEGQLRECKVFAEKNGIQIIDTYIDRAMSAKTDNRPDFQKMIKDSAKQQFETVIVWKLDRFARNRYDSAHYKSILKRNNVRVLSATEAISQGAEGIILESVLEGMAEYYSAELAEKVIRGQTENALSCRFNGGTVPVGYSIVNQHFVVNNETAPLVLSAYKMYDEGKTMQEIADDLNVKGLRNTRGTKLTINTVSNLLTNRRYIGEYTYRDIVVPDGIPAIVPKDLFNRVQERIAKNKKSPARHRADEEYILSTKLYCGKCMTFMVGESGTARNKETYRYYKCLSAKRKRGCDKKAVKKKWIEDIVIDQIFKCIWDDNLIEDVTDLVIKMQRQENTAVSLLNKRLDEVNKSISNILSAIERGIFTPSTKQRLEELEDQKKEFEIEVAKENITRPTLDRDQIKFWFHRFRKMDASKPENRRRLVDSFVNSVILYDDRIEFYFNFKKGAKTLSLTDLEKGSDMLDSLPPMIGKYQMMLADHYFFHQIGICGGHFADALFACGISRLSPVWGLVRESTMVNAHFFKKRLSPSHLFFAAVCCLYSDRADHPFERLVLSPVIGLIKREAVGAHCGNAFGYLPDKGVERKEVPNRGEAGTCLDMYGSRIC